MATNDSEAFPPDEADEDSGGDESPSGDSRSLGPSEVEEGFDFFDDVQRAYDLEDPLITAMLANMIEMRRIEESNNEVLKQLRAQRDPDARGKFPTEMSHEVPSETPTTDPNEVERTPVDQGYARITAVSFGWPDGAANAVGIQLATKNGLQLFPRNSEDNFVAFNDFSETFPFDYTLQPGEALVARTVNLDTTNDHFVNIVPHIEELRPEVAQRRLEEQEGIFGGGGGGGDA